MGRKTNTNVPSIVPTIVALGKTGDGKSNLGNWLLGNPDAFCVSDAATSCTDEAATMTGPCFGNMGQYTGSWQVVDTPGLSDSAGRDSENLTKTIMLLQNQIKSVNAFVLVVNAQQDRMSFDLQETIKVFRLCFGQGLWANLCVVFTKWDWEKDLGGFDAAKLQRRKDDWRKWFQQCEAELSSARSPLDTIRDVQFFAVDNPALALVLDKRGRKGVENILSRTSPDKCSSTGEQLRMLYNHLYVVMRCRPPIDMQLAVVNTENLQDQLQKKLKEERAKVEAERLAHEKKLQEAEQRRLAQEKAHRAEQERLAREAQARQAQLQYQLQQQAAAAAAAEARAQQEAQNHRQEVERLRREAEQAAERERQRNEQLRRESEQAMIAQRANSRGRSLSDDFGGGLGGLRVVAVPAFGGMPMGGAMIGGGIPIGAMMGGPMGGFGCGPMPMGMGMGFGGPFGGSPF